MEGKGINSSRKNLAQPLDLYNNMYVQVHERQPSDERDVLHDRLSDDEGDSLVRVPDLRRHEHCSQAATGCSTPAAFRRLSHVTSRDQQEPEVELTDCSSCSSVDTSSRERHTVPTHGAGSPHKLDTLAGDDDDDDDEIINVVDDLVT